MSLERADEEAPEAVGRWGFRLTVATLIASVWVADLVAQVMGYYVYLLTDPKVQSVWASLLLVAVGGPILAEAVAEWRRRSVGARSVTIAAAIVPYVSSLYNTYVDPNREQKVIHLYYWVTALVIVLACLGGLLQAARRREE